MLAITPTIAIADSEIDITAVRAQGAGGQHVNKAATAIHLRFDIIASSSLPDFYKTRLLNKADQRITADGVIIIKAQNHRSQEMNRQEALRRLRELLQSVAVVQKSRRPTRPTASSRQRRLAAKSQRSRLKSQRTRVSDE
ncbi:MAG: alternative ribosome rescue aminoacyl-tRNA hydrolase ArfB [Thermodesulfobacteriota bacterium]